MQYSVHVPLHRNEREFNDNNLMTPLAFVDNEITEPKTKKNDARRPTGTTTAS